MTGFLVDTGNPTALAGGIAAALTVAAGPSGPEFADRAREMVARGFTIQAMASTLAAVYREVAVTDGPNAWAMSLS